MGFGSRPGGSEDLGINDLSIGVSKSGMKAYREAIKISLLKDTITKMEDDWEAVETAINGAWQGASRDRFLDDFAKRREAIEEDLRKEQEDLDNRLEELESAYYKQDNNLYQGGE